MSEANADGSAAVIVQRYGPVLQITLNRPEVRNAVDPVMAIAIGDALESAHVDHEVRAVIITGAGDQAFCSGANLRSRVQGERAELTEPRRLAWGFAGYVRHHIDKPTIAAVNGWAVAGGAEIALASDLIVAASTARFAFPEVKVGLFAGAGGAFRLPRQIPQKVAVELMLTGEPLSAQRAHELGMVNRVVDDSALQDEAMALAQQIAEQPVEAVLATLRVARGMVGRTIPAEDAAWELTMQEIETIEATPEAREGSQAFAEKRPPRWASGSQTSAASPTSTTGESR